MAWCGLGRRRSGRRPHRAGGGNGAPTRLIVRFAPGGDARGKLPEGIPGAVGATVVKYLPLIDGAVVDPGPAGADLYDVAAALTADPGILYAEPDYALQLTETLPNDPQFGQLWGLHNTGQTGGTPGADISAPEAWDSFTGSASVVIASIDTGVDYTHPDLAANMWVNPGEIAGDGLDNDGNGYVDDLYGIDAPNGDSDPMDDHGHGTHTAGTMGGVGDNAVGVAGVNWDVQIMAVKFLDAGGSGWTSDAVTCLEYITMMKTTYGVNVVASNNSWGGGGYSTALEDAIRASNDAGIMFVAAAGNYAMDNDAYPFYPASYDLDGVISVAATDHNDQMAGFSNWGLTSVDLGAPGVDT